MAADGGAGLANLVDTTISVITFDGRNLVGTLRGYDQFNNLVLEDCSERVYSTKSGVEQLVLGLYIVRGENVAIIGEIDNDADSALDLSSIRAAPLKPIVH